MAMIFNSADYLNARTVEPVQRMCGGSGPRWVSHRFPIKGGLPRKVMWEHALYAQAMREPSIVRLLSTPADPNAPIVLVKVTDLG
jgi:hypothetical protein